MIYYSNIVDFSKNVGAIHGILARNALSINRDNLLKNTFYKNFNSLPAVQEVVASYYMKWVIQRK